MTKPRRRRMWDLPSTSRASMKGGVYIGGADRGFQRLLKARWFRSGIWKTDWQIISEIANRIWATRCTTTTLRDSWGRNGAICVRPPTWATQAKNG